MNMPLQNSYIEILTPKVIILRSAVFGRWLGQKCTALIGT